MSSNASANRGLLIAVASATALALGMLAAIWLQKPATVALQSGTLLQQPRPLGEFQAVDQDGAPAGRAQFEGHWTLIFPGFTSCPDVCPTTLALLKNVMAGLGDDAGKLRVTFLSVDPERDTPARLKQYVQYFDPAFTALAPTPEQLKAIAQQLGVAYAKVPGATPDSYTMDHSAALILIDPQARIAGYLTPPFDVARLSADLRTLIDRR
ncbi:SCO family protein [Solimonas soli]|uniref:SCO family protein n=1 Tax=Solimonas soli TaxID=413479 RepID=UPI0004B74A61|nr:SCO family protein [Solimonas soli]